MLNVQTNYQISFNVLHQILLGRSNEEG